MCSACNVMVGTWCILLWRILPALMRLPWLLPSLWSRAFVADVVAVAGAGASGVVETVAGSRPPLLLPWPFRTQVRTLLGMGPGTAPLSASPPPPTNSGAV
jgi:hypothetical protein